MKNNNHFRIKRFRYLFLLRFECFVVLNISIIANVSNKKEFQIKIKLIIA